jgi:hypothetical protein
VREMAPKLTVCAEQEAAHLRAAYAEANELGALVSGSVG